MKYIADNKIRSVLERKTPKKIVSIDKPYISPSLKTPSGDLMILVYESLDDLLYMTPDQSGAYSLKPIENEVLYALMTKGGATQESRFDSYMFFSTQREWLEEYAGIFDPAAKVEVVEIDDFAKAKSPIDPIRGMQ